MRGLAERDQQSQPQKPQPGEQETEVIACGGEDGIDGVAGGMRQVIAAHAVLTFEIKQVGASRPVTTSSRPLAFIKLAAIRLWPRFYESTPLAREGQNCLNENCLNIEPYSRSVSA